MYNSFGVNKKTKMTVKKYHSFEEARRDQWVFSPDADYYKKLRNFYRLAHKLTRPRHRKGIFKFRDIKESQGNSI